MEILFMLVIFLFSASIPIAELFYSSFSMFYVHFFNKPLLSPPLPQKEFPLEISSHG